MRVKGLPRGECFSIDRFRVSLLARKDFSSIQRIMEILHKPGKKNLCAPHAPSELLIDFIAASITEKYDFGEIRSDLQRKLSRLTWDVTGSCTRVVILIEKSYSPEMLAAMRLLPRLTSQEVDELFAFEFEIEQFEFKIKP